MEKLVLKGKKEIRRKLVESLHLAVQAMGLSKPKKKIEKVMDKTAKRIAELIASQIKNDSKKVKDVKEEKKDKKEKKDKTPNVAKAKKPKKVKEPDLEIA